MLKPFVGVLASQMKLYRVKQGRERGSRGYFNKWYALLKWFVIRLERLPASCRVCCLPLIARHNSVVSVVILLIGVETSPTSFYDRDDRQRPLLSGHYASPLRMMMLSTCLRGSWPTHTEGGNDWTCKLTKKPLETGTLKLSSSHQTLRFNN